VSFATATGASEPPMSAEPPGRRSAGIRTLVIRLARNLDKNSPPYICSFESSLQRSFGAIGLSLKAIVKKLHTFTFE